MANLTATFVLDCDNSGEFLQFVARLDAYEADPQNIPLISRNDDSQNLKITYTFETTVIP